MKTFLLGNAEIELKDDCPKIRILVITDLDGWTLWIGNRKEKV